MKDEYPNYRREGITSDQLYQSLELGEREIVDEFLIYCSITAGKSKLRDIRMNMLQIRDVIEKPFDEIDLQDVRTFLALLNRSGRANWTQTGIKIHLKKFLRWRFQDWNTRFVELRDIKTTQKILNEERINESTLITPEELKCLLYAAGSLRDKALLMVMYESAARPQELRLLKWRDVRFLDDGITEITLYSRKTTSSRTVFVKDATMHLRRWSEEYATPHRSPDDYVFPSLNRPGKPLTRCGLNSWLLRLADRAGLDRRLYPYLFRHTRLTELWRLMQDILVHRKFAGHSKDSSMTSVYVHLSTADVKDSILRKVYQVDEPSEANHTKLAQENEALRKELKGVDEMRKELDVFRKDFHQIASVLKKVSSIEQLEAAYERKMSEAA